MTLCSCNSRFGRLKKETEPCSDTISKEKVDKEEDKEAVEQVEKEGKVEFW